MIPRLWVCTSHPVAAWISLPINPLIVLALVLLEDLFGVKGWVLLSITARRLWQSLGVIGVCAFAATALMGGVISLLGADPDPVFRYARSVWPFIAIAGVVHGGWCVRRDVRRGLPSAAAFREQYLWLRSFWRVLNAGAFCFGLSLEIISALPLPWRIPADITEFFFDILTPAIASDECLAFRYVDDAGLGSYAGDQASEALVKHGPAAAPGVADFLADQLASHKEASLNPGIQPLLVEIIAQAGDSPVLRACEQYQPRRVRELRSCISSGRHVLRSPSRGWECR